jgi:S-adenosylmethionine/arginine decarboxylase-like enzyme
MKHIICKLTGGIHSNSLLEESVIQSATEFNLDVKGAIKHEFETPPGITIILLLGESHYSLHSFYENDFYMVDLFSCSISTPGLKIIKRLAELTNSKIEDLIELERN